MRHDHLTQAQHMQETTPLLSIEVRDTTQGACVKEVRMHPKSLEQPGETVHRPR